MSLPNSIIKVMSGVPLNNRYDHTLFFESIVKQEEYFNSKVEKTFNKFTYIRANRTIKIAGIVGNAQKWNYLMVNNPNDYIPWEYYFINKVEYINDDTVELHIELDVIQTYCFIWRLKDCFIERSHTYTDEFGQYTIPEGLETGPLINSGTTEFNLDDCCILMSRSADTTGGAARSRVYGGVYSGIAVYAANLTDYAKIGEWMDNASAGGYIDSIVSIWMYPKSLVSIVGTWSDGAIWHEVKDVNKQEYFNLTDRIGETIDGYLVKNKKTLTYPYTMLYLSNNMGGSAVYRRELFDTSSGIYQFSVRGALSPEAGVMLTPGTKYKGTETNFEESLSLGGFPTCAWNSDTYKVWLAQNQHTMDHNIQQAKIQMVAGFGAGAIAAASGNIAGTMGGIAAAYHGFSQIQGIMAQKEDMEIQPPQARGNHSGNINLTHGRMGFTAYLKTVTREYAIAIDNFFTMYGYKVNWLVPPTICNRSRFTYIKTVGCFVTGKIGSDDQVKIQSIFDKGITFWKDVNGVGDYYTPNDPLGAPIIPNPYN